MAIASVLVIAVGFAVMTAVVRGNRSSYFKMLADRNEHYLELEMERFNSSKELTQETRRIRHDMKNHLLSIGMLLDEGKTEEARSYVESITETVEKLSPDISTGHVLVDAILSDRRRKAEKIGAEFEVEGNVPKDLHMENVDLCTILANGMDNALEAVARIETGSKNIKCVLKNQGGMLYINIKNTTSEKFTGETSKDDKKNHGFGMMNMRMAVEKYDGVMEARTENEDGVDFFIVEIMV
jgi:sensor histidine kinase regulating citrate/malate metabolism